MDKDRHLYIEYIEFLILGILFFVALYFLFMFKANLVCVNTKVNKNEVELPSKTFEQQVNQNQQTYNTPLMTVVEDSKTPYRYEDDVVNYNSAYYSLMLPYNLSHYTDKYGANESSRKLVTAMKQLYEQILQNKMIQTPQEMKSFRGMLFVSEQIVLTEDVVYKYLKTPENIKKDSNLDVLKKEINQIDPLGGKYPILLKNKEKEVVHFLHKAKTSNAQEAVVIITTINEHLLILSKRTISDFNFSIQNNSYDYLNYQKPVIFNIIDRIDEDLSRRY